MARNEIKGAGDLGKQQSQLRSSVPAGKPGSTDVVGNRGDTVAKSRSGPTELPPQFGRYRVKKKLGGGGMGTVYLVENTELEREEALKVPHFSDGDDPQLRERFLREAKSAAKLDHANLCPIYDAGVQDGIYYLTMRLLKGKLLSDYTGRPQPGRKAVEIVTKLAQALEAAHGKGVIHRDLKPSNVMMVGGAGPVVMDFGLAKQVRQANTRLTQSGATLGTPAYMPPEQVNGDLDAMGPASDVYSLGVILFELLTGRLPFEGSMAAIFGQILYTEPPLPSALVPGLNPALNAICKKAMAKASTDRYPSMKAFAAALMEFLRKTPATAGAGNLVPNTVDKAAVFEAATVAPGPLPADKADIFQARTLVPSASGAGTPTQLRKPKSVAPNRSPRPATSRGWSGMVVTAICVLILGAIGYGAFVVIRVRTADGILVVQVNEPDAELYVDGDRVKVTWKDGGLKAEVGVKPGTRKVELKKDGFRAFGQEVTLEDERRTVLVARLEPLTPPPQVAPGVTPAGDPPNAASENPNANPVETASTLIPGAPAAPTASDVPRDAVRGRPQPLNCTGANGVSADVVRQTQEAWAKYLGRNVEAEVEIANGVKMTFVLVPPGTYVMGSPPDEMGKGGRYHNESLHVVTLTEPIDMGKYEVTQAQYEALTGKTPSFYKGSDLPVEQVTWKDADAFGRDLTKKLSDRHVYRMVTEAEWEYSCRGGRPSSLAFGVGDGRSLTPRDANFDNLVGQTSKVGSYAANALGLCDMHGNVWEWCADWNEPYPNEAVTNPLRTTGGPFRVARGGCHNEPAPECRSALRQGSPEDRRDCWMGFRLARSVPSTPAASQAPPQSESPGAIAVSADEGGVPGENSLKMKFCLCPGAGFYMGKYEVTQSEWGRLMGSMPSHALDKGKGDRFPIYYVSLDEATQFCQKLTDVERKAGRLPKGWVYRLPTEPEWEIACRAGTTTFTAFGDSLSSTQANFNGDWPHGAGQKGPSHMKAVEVGSYRPNAWGICDMHGNVKEFTTTPGHVRGGSWYDSGRNCGSEIFIPDPPSPSESVGFRVALVPTEELKVASQGPRMGKGLQNGGPADSSPPGFPGGARAPGPGSPGGARPGPGSGPAAADSPPPGPPGFPGAGTTGPGSPGPVDVTKGGAGLPPQIAKQRTIGVPASRTIGPTLLNSAYSGIEVAENQKVRVTVTGQMKIGGRKRPQPVGADVLVIAIGEVGFPPEQRIQGEATVEFTAKQAGGLFLGIRDKYATKESSQISVTIELVD